MTAPRAARTASLAAAVLLAAGGFLLAGGAAAQADDGGDGGIGISVQIPATTSPTTGDGSSGGGGAGTPSDLPTPATTTPASGGGGSHEPGADNGPVNVSGLHAQFTPALNPLKGSLTIWFTVHNGSKSSIAATSTISVTGPVGNVVIPPTTIAVPTMKPGATVDVRRTVTGVGQWTVLTAHATLTPPATIDGVAVKPISRDVTVFAFPWVVTAVLTALAAGLGIVFLVLRLPAAAIAIPGVA